MGINHGSRAETLVRQGVTDVAGVQNFDLSNNISRASLLLCKQNKKLHKSKTSKLKHEIRMIYTQKRTRIKELTGGWDWEDVVWRGNHRCR